MEGSFRIGDWLVEPLHNRLVRGDTRVKLDPKVMQVLLYLAEHSKEIAEKEKIIESVWEGAFVTDEVLTNAIWELRKAFSDDAKEPRFVQTVPRKGYRLLAPVQVAAVKRRSLTKAWVAVTCLGIVATMWWYLARNEFPAPQPRITPLTGFPGAEWWPALSPNGERVAFVWDGGKPGPFDLYIQMVAGGDPLRLTETSFHEYSPVWSPDEGEIAFLRETNEESDVLVISTLGGQERRLGAVAAVDRPGVGMNPGLAWSPDGRFLVVVDRASPEEPRSLFFLSLDSGVKRRFTSGGEDDQPAFSPDGKTLAFARNLDQIYSQPLGGGEPRLPTTVDGWITDLEWTADGSAIVYAAGTENQAGTSLGRIPASGGTPVPLPFGEMTHTISIARNGTRMVYDRRSWFNTDIWRIDGPASRERGPPTRLIASSRFDWAQEYSPDGTKIAFGSERSGNNNIWVCEGDGTGCFQRTHLESAYWPRWSPDSKRLVLHGFEAGTGPHLYISEVEGGFTRRLTPEDTRDFAASWSHDGEWIYFTSARSGEQQIWKMPAKGGESSQVTNNGGQNPRESVDGRFLYYANRQGRRTIRRVSVDGGEELPISREHQVQFLSWTLWGHHIVYATGAPQDRVGHVEFLDLETGELRRLFSSDAGLAQVPQFQECGLVCSIV